MDCYLVKDRLGRYLDGELPQEAFEALKQHIRDCEACRRELLVLQRLQALSRRPLFPEPPRKYWREVPRQITQRLGLKPRASLWNRAISALESLAFSRRMQVGLVGGAVVLGAVLFFRIWDFIGTEMHESPSVVSEQPRVESLEKSAEPSAGQPSALPGMPEASEKPAEILEMAISEASTGREASQVLETDAAPESSSGPLSEPAQVEAVPPRMMAQRVEPDSAKRLFPIPVVAAVEGSAPDSETLEAESVPERFSLQLAAEPKARDPRGSADVEMEDRPRDSYAETLWFVQQSATLEEKKNIWLSYLNRESDPTYRSLAYYHLALVLSKEVEDSRDVQAAREALDFYREHEEVLREEMGESRYEAKVEALNMVINNKR